jgi:predicted nuclease of predicted toxin-antitoxin system
MPSFIIDENLPYYFSLWHNKNHINVFDIPNISTDEEIWNYAKRHIMVIVSKDADFSTKILFNNPPPKVIHLKIGNMKIAEFYNFLNKVWPEILIQIKSHKLVNV